jgi:hypothetical protein
LGEIIGQNREARRQRNWRYDRFAMPHQRWEQPSRYHRPAPPPSFFWRFESR